MENWIIFKGDIPLHDFLEKNQPSKIEFVNMAVFAGDPEQRTTVLDHPGSISEPQQTALLQEWDEKAKKLRRISPFYVRHLAKKYAYMSGKWLIYCPRSEIDAKWKIIAKAVVRGKLGSATHVFKMNRPGGAHYGICVYTEDFTNQAEVWGVQESLRKLGITDILRYKPNIYTTLEIFAGNPWGIMPTIYQAYQNEHFEMHVHSWRTVFNFF